MDRHGACRIAALGISCGGPCHSDGLGLSDPDAVVAFGSLGLLGGWIAEVLGRPSGPRLFGDP